MPNAKATIAVVMFLVLALGSVLIADTNTDSENAPIIEGPPNAQPKMDTTTPPGGGPAHPPPPPPIPMAGAAFGPRGPLSIMTKLNPPPPEWLKWIGKELSMSEDQVKQGQDLLRELRDKLKTLWDPKIPRKFFDALRADPTDATTLNSLAAEAIKQEQAVLSAEIEMWLKFDKLLSPEQQKKFWGPYFGLPPEEPEESFPPSAPATPSNPPTPEPGSPGSSGYGK